VGASRQPRTTAAAARGTRAAAAVTAVAAAAVTAVAAAAVTAVAAAAAAAATTAAVHESLQKPATTTTRAPTPKIRVPGCHVRYQ
jgi:hypothetical protein